MDEDFYKNTIFNSPTGYAFHKVIYDENEKPIDYIFLEVNPAFENYTGLKAKDVLNKKVTDVLPEIQKDDIDWIEEYGLIALKKKQKELEGFSKTLNRHYNVKVFSPKKGYFITLFSDISINKTLEKQIYLNQELVKTYWNTADVLFIVLNRDGTVEAINHKGCSIIGLDEKQIVGKNWFSAFLPPQTQSEVKKVFKQIINGKIANVEFYENPIVDANGDKHIIYFHNTILRDEFGKVLRVLSAGNDITEQRHAEASLLESEEKFRYIFDNSAIGKSITFLDGSINANNTFCTMLQYSKNELEGEKWRDLTHPDDIKKSQNVLQKLLSGKNDFINFEKRYVKKDGTILWADVYTRIRKDPNGTPMYFMTSIIDITSRKKAHDALLDSQAIMKAAFENSQAGIVIADAPSGKLRYVNKAGLQIRNKTKDALVRGVDYHNFVDIWNVFHLDGASFEAEAFPLARAIIGGDEVSEEFIIRRDNNEDRIVLANAGPIRDSEKNIVAGVIVFLDITDQKRLEDERRDLDVHLHQQQRLESIGILAGGVAHEINNPINGIMNYSQLILDESASDSSITNYAREIIHETKRVTEIVRNLLQFSRNDKQEHSYARIDDIIKGTTSLINTVMKQDQITLKMQIPGSLPMIKCRSQQIQQVIMNLLTNARDALNEKYKGFDKNKVITLSCEQFSEENRKWIRILIKDHGNGIPEDVQQNIFNPFFTTKGRDKGTGLGLSISYGIVQEHHGKLFFKTKIGQYTTFFLELPVDNGWDYTITEP